MESYGKNVKEHLLLWTTVIVLAASILYSSIVFSAPDGVTITTVGNTTKTPATGGSANFTGNSSSLPNTAGGYIFIMNITGATQNTRWKAYIGNASGKLALQDSGGFTLYDWTLSTISGEVYATRSSATINWTGIGCANLNVTELENRLLNHSSKDDNITATFATTNNDAMTVGTRAVSANTCRTLNVWVNNSANAVDSFDEIVLHDQNFSQVPFNDTYPGSFGSIIYAQVLEQDQRGHDNSSTYDFEMLVPERGSSGWTSATAYYFYIELS